MKTSGDVALMRTRHQTSAAPQDGVKWYFAISGNGFSQRDDMHGFGVILAGHRAVHLERDGHRIAILGDVGGGRLDQAGARFAALEDVGDDALGLGAVGLDAEGLAEGLEAVAERVARETVLVGVGEDARRSERETRGADARDHAAPVVKAACAFHLRASVRVPRCRSHSRRRAGACHPARFRQSVIASQATRSSICPASRIGRPA